MLFIILNIIYKMLELHYLKKSDLFLSIRLRYSRFSIFLIQDTYPLYFSEFKTSANLHPEYLKQSIIKHLFYT
jgi:hypothetical protein